MRFSEARLQSVVHLVKLFTWRLLFDLEEGRDVFILFLLPFIEIPRWAYFVSSHIVLKLILSLDRLNGAIVGDCARQISLCTLTRSECCRFPRFVVGLRILMMVYGALYLFTHQLRAVLIHYLIFLKFPI